jgi:hypothetical protein
MIFSWTKLYQQGDLREGLAVEIENPFDRVLVNDGLQIVMHEFVKDVFMAINDILLSLMFEMLTSPSYAMVSVG